MHIEVLFVVLDFIWAVKAVEFVKTADEATCRKLCCTCKGLKFYATMPIVKTKAACISYFKALQPVMNFLMSGVTISASPTVFYCVRQNDNICCLKYKVTISEDVLALNVISYITHRRYNMDIKLYQTTDSEYFSGRLYCTFLDSGDSIVTVFKISRRSPTLFNELLDDIRSRGVPRFGFHR